MDTNEKQKRLREYLNKISPSMPIAERPDVMEHLNTLEGFQAPKDLASQALEGLARNQNWSEPEMDALEAIILPRERPVVDIVDDAFQLPAEPFGHLYNDRAIYQNIDEAIPKVGRIELPGQPQIPYGGTGFVVGRELLMTNRHVAELFCQGLGRNGLSFRTGQTANVDFKREIGPTNSGNSRPFRISKVLMIHPYWDMALLQTVGLEGISGMTLSTEPLESLNNAEIVVIGYPALDYRNDVALQNQIFRSVFNVKRLQPGKLNGVAPVDSFQKTVNALMHDASTLGGNSGSVVLEVKTGRVVGLHFAGVYLKSNYAVPARSLAEDRRMVDAGINFQSQVAQPGGVWEKYWKDVDEAVVSHPDAASVPPRIAVAATNATPAGRVYEMKFNVPLEITVSFGAQTTAPTTAPALASPMPVAYPLGDNLRRVRESIESAGDVPDLIINSDCLSQSGFDLNKAVLLAQASRAAYGDVGTVSAWATPRGFTACNSFDRGDVQGFWCKAGDTALLCFRGTSNPAQWLRDAEFIPALYPWGWVHVGFRDGVAAVEPDLLQFDEIARNAKNLWITGHSLGGALAVIAAARFKIMGLSPSLYTYGQPRVGFIDFADRFGVELPGALYRFVNQSDIVTRVPPGFLYQHCGIVKRIVRPGLLEAVSAALPKATFIDHDVPPMNEQEFAQLQNSLRAAPSMPATESVALESLLPWIDDHFIGEYIRLLSDIRNASPLPSAN